MAALVEADGGMRVTDLNMPNTSVVAISLSETGELEVPTPVVGPQVIVITFAQILTAAAQTFKTLLFQNRSNGASTPVSDAGAENLLAPAGNVEPAFGMWVTQVGANDRARIGLTCALTGGGAAGTCLQTASITLVIT